MSAIPIDEAALVKAEKAYVEQLCSSPATKTLEDLQVAVSAYLEAAGFRREMQAAALYFPATHERLIGPWRPLTDMEEER